MEVLTLDLATFPAGASQVVVEARPDQIGLDSETWTGPVKGRLRVEKSGDQVTVRGELEAVAHLECVRCLDPLEVTIRAPFQVFAERPAWRLRRGARARRLHDVSRRAAAGSARTGARDTAARSSHDTVVPAQLPGTVPAMRGESESGSMRVRAAGRLSGGDARP